MTRMRGSLAGGNLVRGLLTAGGASAAAFLLMACMAEAGRMDDGVYYGPNTKVEAADWGIVENVDSLADGTVALRVASCLRTPGDKRYIGTQDELVAVSRNPNSGLELIGDGFVTGSDGQVFACGTQLRASESSGYTNGQVVPIPSQ